MASLPQSVRALVLDIETVVDGRLVQRVKWPSEPELSPEAARRRLSDELLEASNGVEVDGSAPSPGTVLDGNPGDIAFQVSRTNLAATWIGFDDPHSGIAQYEWAIGTTSGDEPELVLLALFVLLAAAVGWMSRRRWRLVS